MISRAQYVGNVVINGLESGIGYLPFFIVICLSDISNMSHHDDIQLQPVFFDPLSLLIETGTLITNARPVLLCLFMPDVSITLSVRQNDQGEKLRIWCGFLIRRAKTRRP